ncbi:unnamed protein product [Rotaria sp. Silwood2]|nr:unnamed protein product [Rotaria sp. Silwood2]CAF4661810.1 unnamed protein product [Rotaria sp. Silwood2]
MCSSSSKKQLTILFTPFDGFGHVYGCIGIAEALKKRGHRIIFGVTTGWKGKLLPYGFEEILYGEETIPSQIHTNTIKLLGNELRKNSYGQLEIFHHHAQCSFVNMVKNGEPFLRDLVKKVKPDIIIIDHYVCQPSLVSAGVPWIWLFSANPLGLSEENCSPRNSGYATDSDRNQWDRFRKEVKRIYEPLWEEFNQWLIEQSASPLTKQMWPFFQNSSPYLNLYLYPEEIDYTDLRPSPLKWFRCNASVRTSESEDEFQLSENLANKPGKLIYMSMGTIGSADLSLMKRLIEILEKSPYRFIISKGPLGDEYALPDNMWGEKVVPQIKILPIVDLVITHGGNSTINEILYFGKPSIILPLFYDQFDNAQRLQEKGYGIRLDAYYCSEEELLNAIEKLLADKELTGNAYSSPNGPFEIINR